jgi:Fe-S cluster biogenesis protein NfuA
MIYTEVTPNPNSVKFVVPAKVFLSQGTIDFDACPSREVAPLAYELFQLPYVKRVFIGRDFVTITKSSEVRWEQIIPEIRKKIEELLASSQPLVNPELAKNSSEADTDPVAQRIREIIETQIRPAVAMDGGDILFHSYENGTVYVTLRGSCSGCPSATLTLQMGIQNLLQHLVPEVQEVKAIHE